MVEEASLAFRSGKIDETRNYHLEEIKHNDLIREKYKKTCASLVAIPIGIRNSAVAHCAQRWKKVFFMFPKTSLNTNFWKVHRLYGFSK